MIYYSGIGSRQTPDHVCNLMTRLAIALDTQGFVLRSGGADGADSAFERGATNKEIYVPWIGFNKNCSKLLPSPEAFTLASTLHPVWYKLRDSVKSLHARNCHQVLGMDLNTPSEFLICWTLGGEDVGGTATAIKLAKNNHIPILNLGKFNDETMLDAIHLFMLAFGYQLEDI